jgi:DNA mismatch endonuclease, patch repair protein
VGPVGTSDRRAHVRVARSTLVTQKRAAKHLVMDRPPASSEAARKRMKSTPRRDTPAELAVRRALHAMGLRYSTDSKPLAHSPRRADIVFRRAKVAVFVDGCFWHGCPVHGSSPRANAAFWRNKIRANRKRDADTDRQLQRSDWLTIRVWEHEDPTRAALRIARRVRARLRVDRRP